MMRPMLSFWERMAVVGVAMTVGVLGGTGYYFGCGDVRIDQQGVVLPDGGPDDGIGTSPSFAPFAQPDAQVVP